MARRRSNEGLMIKDPESQYTPGRRGMSWFKLKKELATLDVVVVAAELGHGKRNHVLSDYTFAVRDEESGQLLPIGKAYSGLTDVEIAELTEHFRRNTIRDRGRYAGSETGHRPGDRVRFDPAEQAARERAGLAFPADQGDPARQDAGRDRHPGLRAEAGGRDSLGLLSFGRSGWFRRGCSLCLLLAFFALPLDAFFGPLFRSLGLSLFSRCHLFRSDGRGGAALLRGGSCFGGGRRGRGCRLVRRRGRRGFGTARLLAATLLHLLLALGLLLRALFAFFLLPGPGGLAPIAIGFLRRKDVFGRAGRDRSSAGAAVGSGRASVGLGRGLAGGGVLGAGTGVPKGVAPAVGIVGLTGRPTGTGAELPGTTLRFSGLTNRFGGRFGGGVASASILARAFSAACAF